MWTFHTRGRGRQLDILGAMTRRGVSHSCFLILVLSLLPWATHGQFFFPNPQFNSSAVTYSVVPAEVGWWQANMHRNHGDGRLALLSPRLRQFMLSDPERFSQWHWIGAIRLPTRWRWLDGSDLLVSRGHILTARLPTNYTLASWSEPFTCLLLCHSRYIAVQGILCYCFDSLPSDRLVSSRGMCPPDIYCVGDGTGASLYEHTLSPGFTWGMPADSEQAVSGLWAYLSGLSNPGGARVYASSSHAEDKYYVCKTDRVSTAQLRPFSCAGQLCAYDGNSRRRWDESQQRCQLYANTHLASLRATDSSNVLRITKSWRSYWVGLSRSLVWMNIDGTYMTESPVHRVSSARMCLAAMVHGFTMREQAVHTMPTDCSIALPFVLEIAPSPTSAAPPTTPSPPTTPATPTRTPQTLAPPNLSPPGTASTRPTPVPATSVPPSTADGGNMSATDSLVTRAPDAATGSTDTVGLGVGLAFGLLALVAFVVLFVFFGKRRGLLEKLMHSNKSGTAHFGQGPPPKPAGQRLSHVSETSRHPILDSAGSFADVIQPSAPPQNSLTADFPDAYYNKCIENTDFEKEPPLHYNAAQDQDSDFSFDDDEFDSGSVYADVDGDYTNDAVAAKTGPGAPTAVNYFVLEPESVYENSDEPIYDVTPDEMYELERVPSAGDVDANASGLTSGQRLSSANNACPPAYSLATALVDPDSASVYEPTSAEDYVNHSDAGITSEPPALPPRNDSCKGLSVQQDDLYQNSASFQPDQHAAQTEHVTSDDQSPNRDHAPLSRQTPHRDVSGYVVTRAPAGVTKNPHMYSRLGMLTSQGEDLAYDHTVSASARPDTVVPAYEDVAFADPDGDPTYSHLDDLRTSFA